MSPVHSSRRGRAGNIFIGLATVLAGLGCSGRNIRDGGDPGARGTGTPTGDASTGGNTPGLASSEYQANLVHALCDNVQTCCTAARLDFDALHCRQTIIQQFVVPLADTSLLYDSARAGACLQAVTRAAQACEAIDVTTCFDAFVGNVPPGAPCNSSFQCARGTSGFAVCGQNGVCAQPRRGAFGDACAFSCIESGDSPTCRSVTYGVTTELLAACHSADGLVCAASATGSATCQPSARDCKQNPGGSCPTGQLCDLKSGTCFAPVPIGGNCAAAPCGSDGYCTSGTCVALKPNVATCVNDAECRSGKCENSSCVPYSKAAADWCGPPIAP